MGTFRTMNKNGSPDPIFETDGQSTHFLTILPARQEKNDQASNQAGVGVKDLVFKELGDVLTFFEQPSVGASVEVQAIVHTEIHEKVEDVLTAAKNWIKRADLFAKIGLTNHSKNRKAYLDPLLGIGWIQLEHPNNITHPNQRYKITNAGRRYLEFVESEG